MITSDSTAGKPDRSTPQQAPATPSSTASEKEAAGDNAKPHEPRHISQEEAQRMPVDPDPDDPASP